MGNLDEGQKWLDQAGADLIRVHLLDVPSTVHGMLLSTNLIENMINNIGRGSHRVNHWRPETDQPARWLTTGVLTAEEGFRRAPNSRDLATLTKHLEDKRDVKNLVDLREKLPDWLVRPELPEEETDENEPASADTEIGAADRVTVGSKG